MADGVEEIVVRRCPSCEGLRGVRLRHADRNGGVCKDCKRGRVVRREEFYSFWLARFSHEELREMAQAIWAARAEKEVAVEGELHRDGRRDEG